MEIKLWVEKMSRIYNVENIVTQLQKYREASKLSVEQLHEKSGIPITTIQRLEERALNINRIPGETVWVLAKALSCQMEDLLEKVALQDSEKEEISKIVDAIIQAIKPLKVYLFGSFASGTMAEDSDFDFYVIVEDDRKESMHKLTVAGYKAIRNLKNRPVDLLVGKRSVFEERKMQMLSVEKEVYEKGIIWYDATL